MKLVKKTKFELEVINFVVCVLDSYGKYDGNYDYNLLELNLYKLTRVAKKTGYIPFQLQTRRLSVYTFQLPIQWQNDCQEWTIF